MAYNPRTGQWEPDTKTTSKVAGTSGATQRPGSLSSGATGQRNTSVSRRVDALTSQDNPLMQQAGARGAQASNRRGLLNSSMGVQAGQTAMVDAALPIASQEAQQAQQANLQEQEFGFQGNMTAAKLQHDREIAQMNLAANERDKASQLAASFEQTYSQMFSNIMNNPELPADVRQDYLDHAAAIRDSNIALVEQMYGLDLDWGTPSMSTNNTRPDEDSAQMTRPSNNNMIAPNVAINMHGTTTSSSSSTKSNSSKRDRDRSRRTQEAARKHYGGFST